MQADVDSDATELDLDRRASGDVEDLPEVAKILERVERAIPRRIEANEENAGKGIAKLVLSLVELLRQLMERQTIRRMDAGTLTDEQVERMGQTFLRLREKIAELRDAFDLDEQDLQMTVGSIEDLTDGEGHGRRA